MKSSIMALLLVVGLCAAAPAVEKPYQTGKIVDVQRKVETRILYYLVNTPITEDDPYYEVSVELGNTVYRGLYIPRHAQDTLPEAWKAGCEVQARIDGRHFYLKPSDGVEVDFTISKRVAAAPPVAK